MQTLSLAPHDLAARLLLAIGLAVFLGLTFEEVYKSERRAIPGGIRSFPMLTLAGAMLLLIEPSHALAFVAGLPVLALWLYAYRRAVPAGGATTSMMIPASNLLAYVIGAVALLQPPWVAVAVTVAAVLLLSTRERLHGLIQTVPRDELLTAGKFLILIGIVLPLAPRQAVTALTPLTPYGLWLAVVAVCTLSYASYLLQRYLPLSNAALLPALLGGTYSSTATTVALAKRLREGAHPQPAISAGIVAATAMMYLRIGAVIAVFNLDLAIAVAPALLALSALAGAIAAFEWRGAARRRGPALVLAPRNPLQIPTALVFAVLLAAISVITVWVRGSFGTGGLMTLSAIVGLADVDPFVLNLAQGGITHLSDAVLCAAVLVAASSNNLAKAGYAALFGGAAARRPALLLALLALVGIGAAALYAAA
ncbi:MAG TPA: DUF4010 domain-containing protein [Pseudolabrys sp.]|nr:DUF4010 domain-containing protein [Pseudolabrys sp.]